jgi:TetR/AcrR family transcriptional regulator, transcriptional repressor for nem operon
MRRTAAAKQETHHLIVGIAARRLRELGLGGAGVARIMSEAGLTHGGFYVHFGSKADLVVEALRAAFTTNRKRWLDGLDKLDDATWLRRIVRRYLNPTHRDTAGEGCPFPALGADLARETPEVRAAFEGELMESVRRVTERLESLHGAAAKERALALTALLGGGVLLSRAVSDQALSEQILEACHDVALELAVGPRPGG